MPKNGRALFGNVLKNPERDFQMELDLAMPSGVMEF
jgi:hypothetical protein